VTAALVLLSFAVLVLAAALVYVLVRGARGLDGILASHGQALEHANDRRRAAEQRAGQAEAELLDARRELRASGYRALEGADVVVQFDDGRAIRAVLERTYADGHSLKHPTLIRAGQDAQSLGGEMFVPAERVTLVQRFAEDAPGA
jgi:hypothetical protein